MIELLRIRDLAVVEAAELEFGSGLNVLTGETGAGKSVILGALALLSGGRASPEMIRETADEAVVEAIFRTENLPALESELAARALPVEDHSVVLRRTISKTGRSRAQVGGVLVPIGTLAELFAGQLEISSQHASQALLSAETQGLLLDTSGGLLPLREQVRAQATALNLAEAEIARLCAESEERLRQQDFLGFQVREIDEAKLVPGERAALEVERRRLASGERLLREVQHGSSCLEGPKEHDAGKGALDLLGEAARSLEAGVEWDPALAELAERLESVRLEAQEIGSDLERYARDVELDPVRLEEVEERLAQIEQLARKYGTSEEEILSFRDRAAAELREVEGRDERLSALEAERSGFAVALAKLSGKLSKGRAKAARVLEGEVEAALAALAMPAARFSVALQEVAPRSAGVCGPLGAERAEFLLAANEGSSARPLRKVASGGELSRVFLAVKSALRSAGTGLVLLFDEVDAGVGGGVAERVGRLLADLAGEHQVLCITHLPQIAALGGTHFAIHKRALRGKAVTSVLPLCGEERVEEIARMAGGETVGEATRAHARALLEAAGQLPVYDIS